MYKKCTSNSHIYTKNVPIVQNLYKVKTKNGLKLEMYVFLHANNVQKTIQLANWNGRCTVCFLYIHTYLYTQCANYTKYIQMVIESYSGCWCMLFCIYKTSTFVTFDIFESTTTPSFLFRNFVKFQDQPFRTQKDSQTYLVLT